MTFSRLALGEPRLRGNPNGGVVPAGGCTEPLVYGSNVLADPSCENLVTGGPGGNEIPVYDWGTDRGLFYSGNDQPAPFTPYMHSWYDEGADPNFLIIQSDAHPRSGTYHLRGGPFLGGYLTPIAQKLCAPDPDPPGFQDLYDSFESYYSARVEPGNLVRSGVWIATPGGSAVGVLIEHWYFDSAQSYIDLHSEGVIGPATGDTYNFYEFSDIAPAGTAYLVIRLWPENLVTSDPDFYDFDDFELEVQS